MLNWNNFIKIFFHKIFFLLSRSSSFDSLFRFLSRFFSSRFSLFEIFLFEIPPLRDSSLRDFLLFEISLFEISLSRSSFRLSRSRQTTFRSFKNDNVTSSTCSIHHVNMEEMYFFDKNAIFENYFWDIVYVHCSDSKTCSKNIWEKQIL